MEESEIEVTLKGAIATIRLNAPHRLNAVSKGMIEDIDRALTNLKGQARVLVLTGTGRAFCSGADLGGGLKVGDPNAPIDYGAPLDSHVNPLMRRLRQLSMPWITMVRGPAAGVGCSLALSSDLIIASENAYFLQAFSKIGLVPDGGSSFLTTKAIGRARASEMMLLAERIPAEKALQWGLINRVVPDDKLEDECYAVAEMLAQGPTRTYSLIRGLCWDALDGNWDEALDREREAQRLVSFTRDAPEGIGAFKERRLPNFVGR